MTQAATRYRSGSLRVRTGALLFSIAFAASLAPSALAQHAGFYDHDRSWNNGQASATGLVPDDYLQSVGTGGPVSNSTPPFGYYTRAKGGGAPSYGSGGAIQGARYYARPSKKLARGAGCPSHTAIYLNGMGGIDPADIDDSLNEGYTPIYGGGQPQFNGGQSQYGGQLQVNANQTMPSEQNLAPSALQTRSHSTNGSRPRRVYYNTGGVISGGKVSAPGYYTWYSRH